MFVCHTYVNLYVSHKTWTPGQEALYIEPKVVFFVNGKD